MAETPRRKVNPPSRFKKQMAEQRHFEARTKRNFEPHQNSGGKFLVTILGIAMVVVALVVGIMYFPELNPPNPHPWLTAEERMVADPSRPDATIYKYKSKEVALWVAGVQNKELSPGDLDLILSKAVIILTVPDATSVVLAAHATFPNRTATIIAPQAAKLHDLANAADPIERECRFKLAAISK